MDQELSFLELRQSLENYKVLHHAKGFFNFSERNTNYCSFSQGVCNLYEEIGCNKTNTGQFERERTQAWMGVGPPIRDVRF